MIIVELVNVKNSAIFIGVFTVLSCSSEEIGIEDKNGNNYDFTYGRVQIYMAFLLALAFSITL